MALNSERFVAALRSGDTDRVNDAIDRIEAVDATDRLADYSALVDAVRPVYEHDDGYVRQSVVRFLRDAYPHFEIRLGSVEGDVVEGYTIEETAPHRRRLVEFLIEALDDEDGRVRRAAADGFDTLGVAYHVAELDDERQALSEELALLAETQPDTKRTHTVRARRAIGRFGTGEFPF